MQQVLEQRLRGGLGKQLNAPPQHLRRAKRLIAQEAGYAVESTAHLLQVKRAPLQHEHVTRPVAPHIEQTHDVDVRHAAQQVRLTADLVRKRL